MRRALFAIAAVLAATSAAAQAGSNDVAFRLSTASYSSTKLDIGAPASLKVSFDSKLGFGASFNHFWTKHLSSEFGIDSLRADMKIELPPDKINAGSLDIRSISAVAQWHFTGSPRVDPYAGAGFAYVIGTFDPSGEAGVTETVHLEDEMTYLANAGVNFRMTPRASVGFDARYIPYRPTDSESGDEGRLDVNPLVYSVAVRFKF